MRSLLRARGLTAAVVCTLAIGIGALTTAFGLADAALWREPPFDDAAGLHLLFITRARPGEAPRNERWSLARSQMLRREATSFAEMANYSAATLTLTGGDETEPVSAEVVSPSYFRTLHATAVRGRVFTADEDSVPLAHPVAVLSWELWRRRFALDSGVIGKTVGVSGVSLTVVGVMPRGFRGLTGRSELWIPTMMAPGISYADYLTTNQNFISVVARLRPAVSPSRARTELAVVGARINSALPPNDADSAELFGATAVSLNDSRVFRGTRQSVLVLVAGVGLLYLLACANVTSLLLGRAASRRREAALRVAVGCGRGRLLRHYLAEGVVLSAAGGAGGLLIAFWTSAVLVVPTNLWAPRNFYGSLAPFSDPAFGLRTLAFGVLLTAVTALIVPWASAVSLLRIDVASGLREGARGMSTNGGAMRRLSARGVIVALEAAVALTLLVASGLMIESFARMRNSTLGVEPAHVLSFWLRPSEIRVPPAAAPEFITRVLGAIDRVPGVVSSSVDGGAPLAGSASSTLHVMGRPAPLPKDAPPVTRHYVGPGHFRTLGIPLLRGRTFTDADVAGQSRVAVISETAARRFWPGEDPIGQRVWFGGGSNFDRPDSSAVIVGIVGDVVYQPLDETQNRASFYTPFAQFSYATRMVFVRTTGDPAAVIGGVRSALRGVDPDLAMHDVQPLAERMGSSWARHRFDAMLFSGFAALALLLAASGIYAVVAYAVGQRTREMGIRLALGAPPESLVALVLRDGLLFPLLGLVAGIGTSLAVTRLLRASLYEVTPTDPAVFGATTTLLVAVAVVACLVPARRAMRADPLVALRSD